MKTKEELNAMKEEVETVNKKLAELNDAELEQVIGAGNTASGCVFIENTDIASGGAFPASKVEGKPAQEGGCGAELTLREILIGRSGYEPTFENTNPEGITFFNK